MRGASWNQDRQRVALFRQVQHQVVFGFTCEPTRGGSAVCLVGAKGQVGKRVNGKRQVELHVLRG